MIPPLNAPRQPTPPTEPPPVTRNEPDTQAQPEEEFSFSDFLDVINPLQHLPGISTVYQKLTGDEMGKDAQLIGDTLFSGLFGGMGMLAGLVASTANLMLRESTGKDAGGHVFAFLASDPSQGSVTPSETASPGPKESEPDLADEIADGLRVQAQPDPAAAEATLNAALGRVGDDMLWKGENRRLAVERYYQRAAEDKGGDERGSDENPLDRRA